MSNPSDIANQISENVRLGMELFKSLDNSNSTRINRNMKNNSKSLIPSMSESQKLIAIDMLKEFKHFSGLVRQENCIEHLTAVIPYLNYIHIPHKEFVFHHSDRGGIFFFILKGSASVFVPKSPQELEREIILNSNLARLTKQIAQATAERAEILRKRRRSESPSKRKDNQNISNPKSNHHQIPMVDDLEDFQRVFDSITSEIAEIQAKNDEQLLSKQAARYTTHDGRIFTFKKVNTLKSCDSFGEVSIVTNNKLRTASIVAADENEGLHLLSILGSDYVKVFDSELNRMNFTLKVLEQTFPLSSRDATVRLAYEFKEIILDKGQLIFTEGSPSKHVYLVKSGDVELIKRKEKIIDNGGDSSSPTLPSSSSSPLSSSHSLLPIKTRSSSASNQAQPHMTVALLGSEAFFGMEDAKIHSFSARSASANTIVYSILRSFMDEIGMLRMFRKKIMDKCSFYQQRIAKLSEFNKEQFAEKKKPHVLSMKEIMKASSISLHTNSHHNNNLNNSNGDITAADSLTSDPYQIMKQQHKPTAAIQQQQQHVNINNKDESNTLDTVVDISQNGNISSSSSSLSTSNPLVVPKIQFKRVMKDFLDAKKVSEILGYFLVEQSTTTPLSKVPKTSRIGRQQDIVNESEEKRMQSISSYNQLILDAKNEQQNHHMQDYIQEEEAKKAKAMQASRLRTNRPDYKNYIRASPAGSISPERKIRAIQLKYHTELASSSNLFQSQSQLPHEQQQPQQLLNQQYSLPLLTPRDGKEYQHQQLSAAAAATADVMNWNTGSLLLHVSPSQSSTSSLSIQQQQQLLKEKQQQYAQKTQQHKEEYDLHLIQNRPLRVRSEWLQGLSLPETDRQYLNQIASQHLKSKGRVPLMMKRQPNFSKLDEKKMKRTIEKSNGKIISSQERLISNIPIQTSLPIIHSYFNKNQF